MPYVDYKDLTHEQKKKYLFDAQIGTCSGCGVTFNFPTQMVLEHAIPKAWEDAQVRPSPDDEYSDFDHEERENHSLMCPPCNQRKHAKTWWELIKENLRKGIITLDKGFEEACCVFLFEFEHEGSRVRKVVVDRAWGPGERDEYLAFYEEIKARNKARGSTFSFLDPPRGGAP